MKPTFALDLTRDAIALLHRTPKGWLSIGEVAFDAPDLDEALDYLRKTALGLSPMGFATKIILPNSQILYTEVEAPGPSRTEKRRQIAAALEGRTPYAVEDLVFDWSGKGATVKVAVVARETLDEAEGFAVQHRLNPVAFVAIPEDGAFVGEPWFGQTVAADTLLAPGEAVDRDRDAVTIVARDLPAPPPEDAPAPAEPVADPLDASPPASAASVVDDPLPGLEEALNADLPEPAPPESAAAAAGDAEPAPPVPPAARAPEPARPEPAAPTPDDDLPESLLRELARDDDDAPTAPLPGAAGLAGPSDAAKLSEGPESDEAPFAHVTDTGAFPDGDDIPPLPPGLKADRGAPETLDDDIPPAPPSAAMMAFASRRSSATSPAASPVGAPPVGASPVGAPPVGASPVGAAPVGAATRPAPGATGNPVPGLRPGQPIPRPAGAKGLPGLVTAPSIPGTRAKPKGKLSAPETAAASLAGPTTVKSPARPGGTFGAAAPSKGRSGVVFMVLVGLLLLFLAAIAAWSSYYLSRNGDGASEPAFATATPVPDVNDEMLADMQDPEGMDAPLPEADLAATVPGGPEALATESLPVNMGGDEALADLSETPLPGADAVETALEAAAPVATLPDPVEATLPVAEAAPPAAAEPAPGTAVATDLTAALPPAEDQDEIFLSAMDAPPPALDALALPTPSGTPDAAPAVPMPPPAFGTVYRFGADGLLVPTPDGILSPDGVMLIAGKPPRLPPPRSEAAVAAALAAAPAAPDLAASDLAAPDLAAPDLATAEVTGTAETPAAPASAADASLVTAQTAPEAEPAPSDPAMAGFRPRPRPEGLAPATDDDAALSTEPASDYAGLRPLPRPATVLAAASASRPAASPADLGAQAASLTAQAEAQLAAAAALEAQNPSVVAISKRPQGRPRDLSRAVEAAVAAAVREAAPAPAPEPEVIAAAAAAPAPALKPEELEEVDEPDNVVAAPKIPTKANVAKQATYTKAINLSKLNLIGTYGTDSRRTALIRQSNGRYKKVKVGDKIDGGTIQAITETEVRYQKGGKLLSLKMPKS